ncbi:MAG: hypothetical protein IPJ82_15875 [Lewinellaceae bacterium]|nr:hypothetical protein [Lewinellaceae bacterium]
MMHKFIRVTLLLALIAGSCSLNAQSKVPAKLKHNPAMPKVQHNKMKPQVKHRYITGFEAIPSNPDQVSVPPSKSMLRGSVAEEKSRRNHL